jgi:hypothetical protein
MHCHFLEHEDKECMAFVDITGTEGAKTGLLATALVSGVTATPSTPTTDPAGPAPATTPAGPAPATTPAGPAPATTPAGPAPATTPAGPAPAGPAPAGPAPGGKRKILTTDERGRGWRLPIVRRELLQSSPLAPVGPGRGRHAAALLSGGIVYISGGVSHSRVVLCFPVSLCAPPPFHWQPKRRERGLCVLRSFIIFLPPKVF